MNIIRTIKFWNSKEDRYYFVDLRDFGDKEDKLYLAYKAFSEKGFLCPLPQDYIEIHMKEPGNLYLVYDSHISAWFITEHLPDYEEVIKVREKGVYLTEGGLDFRVTPEQLNLLESIADIEVSAGLEKTYIVNRLRLKLKS